MNRYQSINASFQVIKEAEPQFGRFSEWGGPAQAALRARQLVVQGEVLEPTERAKGAVVSLSSCIRHRLS